MWLLITTSSVCSAKTDDVRNELAPLLFWFTLTILVTVSCTYLYDIWVKIRFFFHRRSQYRFRWRCRTQRSEIEPSMSLVSMVFGECLSRVSHALGVFFAWRGNFASQNWSIVIEQAGYTAQDAPSMCTIHLRNDTGRIYAPTDGPTDTTSYGNATAHLQ